MMRTRSALRPLVPCLLAMVLPAQEEGGEPAPPEPTPWLDMDYGPFLSATVEVPGPPENVALKGIAVHLEDGGVEGGMLFDTELLRMAAGWTGGFLELRGTAYDGAHGPFPGIDGEPVFVTGRRPGWSRYPSFDDPRPIPHGPLPKDVWRYHGLYRHGDRVAFAYRVAGCEILESPGPAACAGGGVRSVVRSLRIGPRRVPLYLLVAERTGADAELGEGTAFLLDPASVEPGDGADGRPAGADAAAERSASAAVTAARFAASPGVLAAWHAGGRGLLALEILPGDAAGLLTVEVARGARRAVETRFEAEAAPAPADLREMTEGGPSLWAEPVVTEGALGSGDGAWVVDTLTVPYDNPWDSWMRIAALDFFRDGRAAVSTWNGDVWIVSGIDADLEELRWQRFATGLFDPLGLKIVDDVVHALGRDGITRLHDLDGDGEADFYEGFNRDVLITEAFHEFAFDLQTGPEGSFFFSKAGPVRSGGRGFEEILPHHGCILKVSPDGEELEVFATGLRAPNGIGVGPDGQVTSGDNEGTWMPRCRLNWIEEGSFLGCVDTAHRDPPPARYDPPLCFLPMEVDNSSGGQVWVTSSRWGPFEGELLHLSYGKCSLFLVLRQEVDGVVQGGVARFPLSFASSCMRGRFHPGDGQLYVVGLKGWQTSAALPSAFHRVRYTGAPARMPGALAVVPAGVRITFTEPVDRELAEDPESYTVERWNYVWSDRYGSPEVSVTDPDADVEAARSDWNAYKHRQPVSVRGASLSDDGRTVTLELDPLAPVMQQRIRYDLDTATGALLRGEIVHTIHRVPESPAGERGR